METEKILIHYVQFIADLFCQFSGHVAIVKQVVVNDTVHVDFYASPFSSCPWESFECDVHFNTTDTIEEQILKAFDERKNYDS
jgi:hypothetical protein